VPVFCLASHEIDRYWTDFAHHLLRFCEANEEYTLDALVNDLKEARKQFWGYHDGERVSLVGVTEVTRPICWLCGLCGTETAPAQIEAMLDEARRWAISIGCTKLKLRGRMGWERRLKEFKKVGVILEQDLCQ
jgi:hypothetical protein